MKDLSILITGGTGSFGRAFTELVLKDNPKKVAIFSRGEHAQEAMAKQLKHPALRFFIGDVRDGPRLEMAMRDIDVVVHAAALKVVPICEYNPQEALATNAYGAYNVVQAAIKQGVGRVLALSTDKAVNPTNLYGATKLVAERLFLAASALGGTGGPKFAIVRYGNVLGSSGSVVPLFKGIAAQGEPLPITHPNMTRFFITMRQATEFVRDTLACMHNNEVHVPRLPAINIMDLAQAVWEKSTDVPFQYNITQIRPGEKIHETLVSVDDARCSVHLIDRFVIDYGRKISLLPEGYHYSSDTHPDRLTAAQFKELI